jgi:hypothetical protein
VLLRLDEPSPGIALVGTHTNVGICRSYGERAEALATECEVSWRKSLERNGTP